MNCHLKLFPGLFILLVHYDTYVSRKFLIKTCASCILEPEYPSFPALSVYRLPSGWDFSASETAVRFYLSSMKAKT